MSGGRRLAVLLAILAVAAAPAVVLRAVCAGKSCDAGAAGPTTVPFCSLDASTRELVVAGFRQGRGPDVLGVTAATPVVTDLGGGVRVPWPSASAGEAATRVPLAFIGAGLASGTLPPNVRLDQVAPTLERWLGIHRPHPEVRSGHAIEIVDRAAQPASLAVVIVWKATGLLPAGVTRAMDSALPDVAIRGEASTGSVPLDPAAVLTTIGSGGLPFQHGVGGTTVRNDDGALVPAFSPRAPGPVIAALGDDLDRGARGASKIGLVATSMADRGLIGGTWYGGADDDRLDLDAGPAGSRVSRFLQSGWGADATPDLLGVVLRDDLATMSTQTRATIERVLDRVPGAVVVVTTTGSGAGPEGVGTGAGSASAAASVPGRTSAVDARDVVVRVDTAVGSDVVAGVASGGLFLNADAMTAAGLSAGDVTNEMRTVTAPDGSPLFADVFPAFAVEFSRYC